MDEHGNPLLDAFIKGPRRSVQKWVDYFEVYHRALRSYRNKPITFLEIGVQNGGSAMMWRDYLGPEAKIIGVDKDPQCKALEAHGFEIWIGDQASPAFWQDFKAKHPALDVVLDDGGHTMDQQLVTFEALWPTVTDGGLYMVEDIHTSYFPSHGGGGAGMKGTFIDRVKTLIDEMHAWYYAPANGVAPGSIARNLATITIGDSIVALEKRSRNPPLALARGGDGHIKNPPAMDHMDMRRIFRVPDGGVPPVD